MSNILTMQDYIDLASIQRRGASDLEQQSFLLSRFYKIPVDEIRKKDMEEIASLSADLTSYLAKMELPSSPIKNVKEEENEKIENRAEILDIRE